MKNFFCLSFVFILCCFSLKGEVELHDTLPLTSAESFVEVETSFGTVLVYRPSLEEIEKTASLAKAIFQEAFATTYREYHQQSGTVEPIETWLRLKDGMTLESWLSQTFDEEYEEYLKGDKGFIYLCTSSGYFIGWLSHSNMNEKGDVYLSQCSFEAGSRHQKIATTVLLKALEQENIKKIFPGVKELKLITRKINAIARHLFTRAGFTMDETINPNVYGDSYDDRYIGYRLMIQE